MKKCFESEEGPGPTSKKKKVEKMMFKREKVDILRTQGILNSRVSDLNFKKIRRE